MRANRVEERLGLRRAIGDDSSSDGGRRRRKNNKKKKKKKHKHHHHEQTDADKRKEGEQRAADEPANLLDAIGKDNPEESDEMDEEGALAFSFGKSLSLGGRKKSIPLETRCRPWFREKNDHDSEAIAKGLILGKVEWFIKECGGVHFAKN